MIRYDRDFPAEMSEAMVELWCYANALAPAAGGLGAQVHLRQAMQLLWPATYAGEIEPGVPRWRDDLELLTWAWCHYKTIAVIGHASAAKTHTFGHIAAAAYIADSVNAIVTLTSTHLSGLRKRLWADTVAAIKSAHLGGDLLGAHLFDIRHHDMTIRPRGSKEDKYLIEGIATDRGHDAVEKIQGTHSRKRRYVIIDEAQGTPAAIFEAASNLMTDPDFRIVMLANPTRRYGEFGTWCEPEAGWASVNGETDTHWATKRGGICIRLDGLKSANIRHGRTVFPFLLRQDYIDRVAKSFGEGSPRWWTFVRGWFAPEGLAGTIYPGAVLNKAERPFDYAFKPTRIAALDPAFEGGDQCTLALAEYGPAISHAGSYATRHAPNLITSHDDNASARATANSAHPTPNSKPQTPNTAASASSAPSSNSELRTPNSQRPWALNLREVINLKLAVTEKSEPLDFLIAEEVMRVCQAHGVAPENFIMDTTGAGRGVAAILESKWSRSIQRCNFGGAPTDRRMKTTDTETSDQLFDRFVSELWWAGRAWMEEGLVGGLTAKFKTLREQLSARQYETVRDRKIRIEPKPEMRERLGYSPDEADAFVMLIELLRRKGAIAGAPRDGAAAPGDRALQKRAIRYSQLTNPAREYLHGAGAG